MARLFEIRESLHATVVHFTVETIIEEKDIQSINESLTALVDKDSRKKFLLDFENVQALSSPAFGMFITLHKKTRDAGGQLAVCNLNPQIKRFFG